MHALVRVGLLIIAMTPLSVGAQDLSDRDQMVLQMMMQGQGNGAVINRDGVCGLGAGFSQGDVFKGFAGLFPQDCGNSFERVNADGSRDRHAHGVGQVFLVAFDCGFYGSEGSYAHWTWIDKGDGSEIGILTANGTLSDGSRFRLHFTNTPGEGDKSKEGFLWVEGCGYVVGNPNRD